MAIFNSYVKLPEGKYYRLTMEAEKLKKMEFIQWEFQHPGAFVTLDDERMIISGAKNGGKTAPPVAQW